MMTLDEWDAMRDLLAANFPVGCRVATTEECIGLEPGTLGTVTGNTSRSIEWTDDEGTQWRMSPASLRYA